MNFIIGGMVLRGAHHFDILHLLAFLRFLETHRPWTVETVQSVSLKQPQ